MGKVEGYYEDMRWRPPTGEVDYDAIPQEWSRLASSQGWVFTPFARRIDPRTRFEQLLDIERELQAAKNADYTGGGRLLANYEEAARATGLKTWQVMLSRIYEKLYRFRMLREKGEGEVEDETLEDTLLDVAILAKLLIIEREEENVTDKS